MTILITLIIIYILTKAVYLSRFILNQKQPQLATLIVEFQLITK